MARKTAMYNEPIAIIGSACRFAGGVDSPSKLWELLRKPQDVRTVIPESRFSVEGFYHSDPAHHGRSNVKHSYLLDGDPAVFDAEFFHINPIESRAMDPQQRILMETVYESIEAGGMTIEGLRGSDTAVYAGVMIGDYEAMLIRDLDQAPTYMAVGTSRAVLSNRISYFFDWHGASVTMDTACSSSLVAVHMAVQTLRAGDSRMAVACGSNVILGPENYIIESKVKMLSPDGLSRMWDKDANGYARGDGVAALVLKPLSAALADNDHIEGLIRETALNQDGATTGLTMPSPIAQRDLIRNTYAKAGLDLSVKSDRPQFFEAHGTGTPAGDPVEAQAISTSFFGGEQGTEPLGGHDHEHPLFVGSIKTVLGHTEGTAGIAAVLKAMLSIQNSCIPPNLLLKSLSSSVAPFYKNLEIPQKARPWPNLEKGQPKRASVNSFGFGGANAHAILESYEQPLTNGVAKFGSRSTFTPFVFSAASEQSLRASLSAYATFLEAHPNVNPGDLAYTLRERRSLFPYRATFPASSIEKLGSNIRAGLEDSTASIGVRASEGVSILAVFTGQGAQYARMGAELISKSPLAKRIIQGLEGHLARLPKEDRPNWSLEAEMLADASKSRFTESSISQPLNTALQLMMVDLLRAANVKFSGIVGHSGGEVAAAYAAGFLSARDALYLAYYRGINCEHAASPNGDIPGAMIVVGTSMEDAVALCEDEEFAGRITLAAVNSPASVTISGDKDAIDELEALMKQESKFYRRLKVDKAYHSKHMLPSVEPYMEGVRRAGVKALIPSSSSPPWFSSVFDGKLVDLSYELSDTYWAENLIRPVLFSSAVKAAVSSGITYDVALEIGPHASLRSPATQNIQDVLNKNIPYYGTLAHGKDAVESYSKALGFLWSHLAKPAVDLASCERGLVEAGSRYHVVKDLPSYQWNHDTRYWHESRKSHFMRTRKQHFHPLLGDPTPDTGPHALRWKNIIKPSELEWLQGHSVQNQLVFPAGGYVSTALEVARTLGEKYEESIRLIEIDGMHIHQAISFRGDGGVEVLIEATHVQEALPDHVIARFTYSAALGGDKSELTLVSDGWLKISFGEPSTSLLPERQETPIDMIPVEHSRLYNHMDSLGYNFTGPFRSLVDNKRKLGRAACVTQGAARDVVLVHPVDLDAAFQAINLAYSYPGDDRLRYLHLPTTISKIRVNPAVFESVNDRETMVMDSILNPENTEQPGSGFTGNTDVYLPGCLHAAVQVDQVIFKVLGNDANDDRKIFCRMDYVLSEPDGHVAANDIQITDEETNLLWALSRIVHFYTRRFDEMVPANSPARSESPLCHYLRFCRHVNTLFERGETDITKPEWANDTLDDILADIKARNVADKIDTKVMLLVGEIMPQVFRGETNMIEHFRTSGFLDKYYTDGLGTAQASQWLGNVTKQLSDRNPRLKFLEIGAGTGGATKYILNGMGRSFESYTFTDISSSFFEGASEVFEDWGNRIIYKPFDVEQDPVEQGFEEGIYDVIVAFQVLHATRSLSNTIRNARKLLKPGGYLLVGEEGSEGIGPLGASFIFGTLPGWWAGVDEGRVLSPLATASQWDSLLKQNGFSGIDTMSPDRISDVFGCVLMASQAVDYRIELARNPLSSPLAKQSSGEVVVVGGQTQPVAKIVRELDSLLRSLGRQIQIYTTLEEVEDDKVMVDGAEIISLVDLEQPVFKDITAERFEAFKKIYQGTKTVLWLTRGRLADEPYCNMPVGFGRCAKHEDESLLLQFLDVSDITQADARIIAETFVCLTVKELQATKDICYQREPEMLIDMEGRLRVPRLNHLAAADDRLNSTRRHITHQVDASKSVVELHQDDTSSFVRQLSRYETSHKAGGRTLSLRTTHSVLSALRTPIGHFYLALGESSDGSRYLCLVSSVTSVLNVPKECTIPCNFSALSEGAILTLIAAQLVAMAVMDPMFSGERILVHNAPSVVARAITVQAAANSIDTVFTADQVGDGFFTKSCIHLPSYLKQTEVGRYIPSNISCFADLSISASENGSTIASALPPYCRQENTKTILSPQSVTRGVSALGALGRTLERAAIYVREMKDGSPLKVVGLETLANRERPSEALAIVDWSPVSSTLPARVTRFGDKPLFKGDKTYWFCGFSGALSVSLCNWMIERGMRNIVVTSRNPKLDQAWIEQHGRNGVIIKPMPCDVTDEKALRAVHTMIVKTLPPIAGALNGAMVLRDATVLSMTFEQLQEALRPKVLGSIHLDRIFHDVDLDFFILLSSAACIIGNVGQANYLAANMGMCAIAGNRRKRGLRSSVANVGAIIGLGYITDSAERLDLTVRSARLTHLSEEDFHQIFAEVMDASNFDSPTGVEMTTGILEVAHDEPDMPKWFTDPKFNRFLLYDTDSGHGKEEGFSEASILESLEACQSEDDVFQIVKAAFCAQLRRTLQISTEDDELMGMRSSNLGLDSLISVDIRTWFLKHFKVIIPVLTIMSSETQISHLVTITVEGIPAELIPQVRNAGDAASKAPSGEGITGSRVTGHNGSTTTELSSSVVETSSGATTPDASSPVKERSGKVDWDAETTPPKEWVAGTLSKVNPPKAQPEVVVLTGVTGLLGHHLLKALAKEPSLRKIICIAVRRLGERLKSGEIPPASERIVYYEGDLVLPRFGLSESQQNAIFEDADAIIHNGADTSHLKFYSVLKDANVNATKQLIALSLPRMIPFHYVSSAGMALFAGMDAFPPVSGTGTGRQPPADGAHGYMCAKWVCEVLLERVNASLGLKIWIERPSTIIREGDDATTTKADFDWVNALIHYCHKTQAVPKVEYNAGAFDLVSIKTCCDDIAGELVRNKPRLSNGMTYVNSVGDIVVPLNRMAELAKDKGRKTLYQVLPWEEWTKKAIAAGLHPAVAALIETFDEPGTQSYPVILRNMPGEA
ncbi:polyketide synthase [Nemania abortiva]|nr:polyketide synthase [Nemania abortiva]